MEYLVYNNIIYKQMILSVWFYKVSIILSALSQYEITDCDKIIIYLFFVLNFRIFFSIFLVIKS